MQILHPFCDSTCKTMISLAGGESLQCYNCRGITNYDPYHCFEPGPKTTMQECQANEVCEVSRVLSTGSCQGSGAEESFI